MAVPRTRKAPVLLLNGKELLLPASLKYTQRRFPVGLAAHSAPHHLFIYDNLDADDTTAWIFTHDGEWEEVNDGYVHPESRDRVLHIHSINGEPNWITHQSYTAVGAAADAVDADGVAGTTVFFRTLDFSALPVIVGAIEHPTNIPK
ncbi:hypothetical protein K488DRAFT_91820 [Vararia minispora EC-137]|uniref:Uncharacterized protein n=1 Tax=Vararia minispora EC-137 TaxID=1314806 RepID=A0ACB8Q5D3_9AGAM|nr:hypothetical protein K488DRAFT_91820 [Vararia minispora EC-137]